MQHRSFRLASARRLMILLIIMAFAATLMIVARGGLAQQQSGTNPSTPARTASPSPQTPTPTPATNTARPSPGTNSNRSSATFPMPPPPPPPPPTPTPTPAGQEVDEDDVVTILTNLVSLNVRVIDRQNRPLPDIPQSAFRVVEDGVEQSIALFTKEEVPISYGLVIDNSGSLRSQLPQVIEAGRTIVGGNKTGDETFLVRFTSSDRIETLQDFTSNQQSIVEALDDMYPEGGQTAVLDAVYLSAERVAQYRRGDMSDRRRRALILVTDGEDRDSFYQQAQLFDQLREWDVQIYVIGFVNELEREGGIIRRSQRERAVNLLNRLASETGGRAFYPTSLAELPGIAEEITRDMRTQYVISYNPTDASGRTKPRDGSYRRVRVTIAEGNNRERRIAVTRPGYTAERETGNAPSSTTNPSPSNTRGANPSSPRPTTTGTGRRP